jgi:hypothetical protein
MFFSEVARIRTSAPGQDGPHTTGTLIEEAARRVVTDQYPDLGEDVRATIVEGWTQSIRQFNRIDWLATIGRDAPGWINES